MWKYFSDIINDVRFIHNVTIDNFFSIFYKLSFFIILS
ncbi:Uncharacterised protein [Klebsiella pneumoniae]|nr:Uncharacterised protein [Klebsiella pneumoniae]